MKKFITDDQEILPHNTTIEQILLGNLLQNNLLYDQISHILDLDCFFLSIHKDIYSVISKKLESGHSVDVITLVNMVDEQDYLKELSKPFPYTNIKEYAQILSDLSIRRKVIIMSKNLLSDCYDESKDLEEAVQKSEDVFFKINEKNIKVPTIQFYPGAQKVFHQAQMFMEHKTSGINTGFDMLDQITNGFQIGELIILAGRPSTGKTAFALNLAIRIAANENPLLFLSLEMPYEQICARSIAILSGISVSTLLFGRVNHHLLAQCCNKISEFKNLPLYINDTSYLNINLLKSLIRQIKRQHKIKVVIVDYLQLIESSKSMESREQEIGKISRSLKMMAKEFGIIVIALSQMSRNVENRKEYEPKLSDLRGSGTIEQDADKVMFLHRPDNKIVESLQLVLAKNRNGTLGTINLIFDGSLMKFKEVS